MGKLIIGNTLQKQKMTCPDCNYKNVLPEFIDETESSNTPHFVCPSCKNSLALKNSNKEMLLGFIVIMATILSLTFLSGIALLIALVITIGGFVVLLKKGIVGTNTEFISKNK